MKRSMIVLCVVAMVVCASVAQAAVVIDFDAVALRAANSDHTTYGTVTEYSNGNGVITDTPLAGQKVYYGTDYFNGQALSSIGYLEFTYVIKGPNNPYSNLVITNGSAYGVISSQGGYSQWENATERRVRYYFAGDTGNQAYGFAFYEPAGTSPPFTHGQAVTWSDIGSWTLLGIGDTRPLSTGATGEDPYAKAPLTDALAIMWGDSESNYLGTRDIYNIVVVGADGNEYNAGNVPEPATILVWSLLGVVAVGYGAWRRRRAG